MSDVRTDTDIDLALDAPTRRPHRRSPGDPNTAHVVYAILVLLIVTALLAGAIGFSMQGML
ncbi:hypothetical protein ABZ814_13600 [Micromonospora musae]|uniref:hypothetical protein n=1 Tax=Micromonospora musae TaxID=1894970 RepID=UPI00340C1174